MKRPKIRPWSSNELRQLQRLAGQPIDRIAATLNRSPASIRSAAQRHRISLRPNGEHRGRLLHEPRTGGLPHRPTSPEAAAEATRRLQRRETPCSRCGRFPQRFNGICEPCRLDTVANAYRETHAHQQAIQTRQRRNTRLRQRARRGLLPRDLTLDQRLEERT